MPTTDTSEKGLESLICKSLVNEARYIQGSSTDFDRDHAVDTKQLFAFLEATQPELIESLSLNDENKRREFLHRLQGEVASQGVINVLRKGINHGPSHIDLFYGTPTPGNATASELYEKNIFSVTRQLHFSKNEAQLSLDMVLFINGLPVMTFELKNQLTKQTYDDAINQYKTDRDPKELLFQFGRCMVHFAVDDHQVWMCTYLRGNKSWFLPFNKGYNDGAGNPPNPNGLATDYLWKEVLQKDFLTNILENYAMVSEEKDEKGRKKKNLIFPRYHQIDVVRNILKDVEERGAGGRYLIQHSAGSGKSNSITWLAHQLVELKRDGNPPFDSIIVVTDRIILDKQIRENIKRFAHVSSTVGAVTDGAQQLRKFIEQGKKIIITTVQKFPFVLDEIGSEHRGGKFALIIDEAHSSQGGRTAAAMNVALSEDGEEVAEETYEEKVNRIIEARKMMTNASYFAFTATPKNKTLELFGIRMKDGKFSPFHKYTMKQAIQEGFILDVLENYIPVQSYYKLIKTIEDDPEFDTKKAKKKLRKYVESHEHAIKEKAEIMIDHFHDHVIAKGKIGGHARAMVVTSGIERAMQYKTAFDAYLTERKSPYKAIVAFSGDHEYQGKKGVTESSMNSFSSSKIPEYFAAEEVKGLKQKDPYRFLIVANKFQTGYDEPLLHTMYVDKPLSGVMAVQTLSRLNRAHPQKYDTFVLDFMNDSDTIKTSFEPYYRTTILSEATDPNKLHDLKSAMDGYQVYTWDEVEVLVEKYLSGAERDELDPILDICVTRYDDDLDEDGQVDFKAKAKGFVRTYNFLSSILPYANADWEKLAVFLSFLAPKLPAPKEEDLAKGILETIDMDSYRVEAQSQMHIALADQIGEIEPVPGIAGGSKPEPELDHLSNIVRVFNDTFGNVEWNDVDKIRQVITEELPAKVLSDRKYLNARKHSDKQNARYEHDKALGRVMVSLLSDHTELFKQFSENPSFKKWLNDTIFQLTYEEK